MNVDQPDWDTKHVDKMTGKAYTNWADEMAACNPHWNTRATTVVRGQAAQPPGNYSFDYLPWFYQITVLLITNPRKYGLYVDGFQSISARMRISVSFFPFTYIIYNKVRFHYLLIIFKFSYLDGGCQRHLSRVV